MSIRLSPEDEHVIIYGRPVRTTAAGDDQLMVKTFNGQYEYSDSLEAWAAADTYPSLSVEKLTKALTDKKWKMESLRISHIQLSGTMVEFIKFASCLKQCNTLKSVMLCDSRTSLQMGGSVISLQTGFDSIISALSKTLNLKEITLQNMPISSEALAELCGSTSLEKLQVMISPTMLPTGKISGSYIQPLARKLRTNRTMKDLRIVGILDYSACTCLSEMLQINNTLEKLSLKIKLRPSRDGHDRLPFISVLGAPSCSLTALELYLSGSRPDVETYARSVTSALKDNTSLKCLNVVFYGMDLQGRGAMTATKTKQIWMEHFAELLRSNYILEQVMINHGLVELCDTVKLYLKLNRSGRQHLLRCTSAEDRKSTAKIVATTEVLKDDVQSSSEDELWLEALIKLRDDVPCLHYLLSSNPGILCRLNQSTGSLPLKRKR